MKNGLKNDLKRLIIIGNIFIAIIPYSLNKPIELKPQKIYINYILGIKYNIQI